MYLRRFASSTPAAEADSAPRKEQRQINICRLSDGIPIYGASLRDQCYGRYFYGRNGVVESALRQIEGDASKVIDLALRTAEVPEPLTKEHFTLLIFLVSLHARTQFAGESLNHLTSLLWKMTLAKHPDVTQEMLDHVEIGYDNPASKALAFNLSATPMALDLSYKLLINRTAIGFITSDNPVVMYNQFFEAVTARSNTGLISRGLQIFLPLDPVTTACFYDSYCYKVGSRHDTSALVTREQDVHQLNDLQWQSALKCIYFSDKTSPAEIARGIKGARKKKRTSPLGEVHEFVEPSSGKPNKASLIVVRSSDIRSNLRLGCIKQIRFAERTDVVSGAAPPRDETLFQLYRALRKNRTPEKGPMDEGDEFGYLLEAIVNALKAKRRGWNGSSAQ